MSLQGACRGVVGSFGNSRRRGWNRRCTRMNADGVGSFGRFRISDFGLRIGGSFRRSENETEEPQSRRGRRGRVGFVRQIMKEMEPRMDADGRRWWVRLADL